MRDARLLNATAAKATASFSPQACYYYYIYRHTSVPALPVIKSITSGLQLTSCTGYPDRLLLVAAVTLAMAF